MDDYPETYVIPTNIANNGNVLRGYFKKKNAYEFAAIVATGLLISVLLLGFLPIIPRIVVFGVFLIIGFLALAGVKGQSFIEHTLEVFFFKKKRRVMKYRLPRKDIDKTPKRKRRKSEDDLEP